MKSCFIVYYADRSANVVICESMSDIPSLVGDKFSSVVKIELIPFDVL